MKRNFKRSPKNRKHAGMTRKNEKHIYTSHREGITLRPHFRDNALVILTWMFIAPLNVRGWCQNYEPYPLRRENPLAKLYKYLSGFHAPIPQTTAVGGYDISTLLFKKVDPTVLKLGQSKSGFILSWVRRFLLSLKSSRPLFRVWGCGVWKSVRIYQEVQILHENIQRLIAAKIRKYENTKIQTIRPLPATWCTMK
jgi:hypothetical protein